MLSNLNMTAPSPEVRERREMVSYVVRFSRILSQCAPHALETSKILYTTLFVREAKAKNKLPQILDEFEQKWEQRKLSLYHLIPHLIDLYVEQGDPDWAFARNHIVGFYDTCKKTKSGNNTTATNIKIPTSFRPLPSLYYSVQNDIQYLRRNHEERKQAYQELRSELQAFTTGNPDRQCPVHRKYVTLQSLAPHETVWEAKKDAFAEIFQRTRELFLFEDEEAHFHHAARILDYWQFVIERRNMPDTRNDIEAFEKQAKEMKTLQRVFVVVLENIQRNLKMNEVLKFVCIRIDISRDFMTIQNAVAKRFNKMKHLLDGSAYVLPARVKQEASLASSLYAALYERQKIHDEIKRTSEQLKNVLLQVRGWENLTGTKLFSEPPTLEHSQNSPPVSQPQTDHPHPTQLAATQGQHREPHVTPSATPTINNAGNRQLEISQLQANELQYRGTNESVHLNEEPQVIRTQLSNQPSNEQHTEIRLNEIIEDNETRAPVTGLSPPPFLSEDSQDPLEGIWRLDEPFPSAEVNEVEAQVDELFSGEPQVSELQVGEPQEEEPRARDSQSGEQQMATSQFRPPQFREQVIREEEAAHAEVEVSEAQVFNENQEEQQQKRQEQVEKPSEQEPTEDQINQQQHGDSPGEAPDANQGSDQPEGELDLDALSPWPSSLEAQLHFTADFMPDLTELIDRYQTRQPGQSVDGFDQDAEAENEEGTGPISRE